MTIRDLTTKVANNGADASGKLTAEEYNVLMKQVKNMSNGAVYMGIATPTTAPQTYDGNVALMYIASAPGKYANFGNIVVNDGEVCALHWRYSTGWSKEVIPMNIDSELTPDGKKPVAGGTLYQALADKVDKVEGKGLSTNDYTNEDKAQVAEVENKANKNGRYLELAAGYYVRKNVELSGEMKSGNINAGGGITNSSSTHLLIDISNVPNDSTIRVSTTYNSEYTTLWALWEVAYDPATVNWKYLLDKGPLCSVAQSADIDLSRYEGRAPRYLYVAVGTEGNSASATILGKVANIEDKFDEVYHAINNINIVMPDEIDTVVGDSMQLFYRSIVSAVNPYNYDIFAVCAVGKSFPRYYEFKPTADMVGKSYPIDIYVKTNDGTIVAQKPATIKVSAAMESPSSTKNILCIGASATAGGQWVGELNRRLTATIGDGTPSNPIGLGLSNIAFVGRKVGTANAIHLEATGGWRVQDYASKGQRAIRFFVTGVDTISLGSRYSCNGTTYVVQEVNVTEGVGNIRCTLENTFVTPSGKLTKLTGSGDADITFTSYEDENFSPFWNVSESRIDFKQYADTYCDGRIDCLVWHCGVNDITSGDPAVIPLVIAAFRKLLTAYHEQFPNGRVIISSVPIGSTNGGFAANYGANESLNYYTFAKIAQLYAQALIELAQEVDFMDFVTYAPALEQFDAENNYPTKEVAVNNRSSIKELIGTNAVHPTIEGSYQVADAIYRAVNSIGFNESEPEIIAPIASENNVYIPKNAGAPVKATTSARGVVSFAIDTGITYELNIPMTGNEYAAFYAFGQESTNGVVADGVILSGQYGVGDTQPAKVLVKTENTLHKYLYVCYTLDGGMPTLRKL